MKYHIQPDYQSLKPLVENIENYFQQSTHVLHKKRNEIRVVTFEDNDYVIKAFRVPNLVNRIAYRYFRPSKAKRSYQYSLKLGKELCPEAVAYREDTRLGMLSKSYFISRHFDFDFEIRAVLPDKSFESREQILKEFADFTFQLHEKNILHRDYSPGNILVKKQGDHFQFKVVDVNRMQFKELDLKERLGSFVRLAKDEETLREIIKHYAKRMELPVDETFRTAWQYSEEYQQKRAFKNKLKGR